MAHIKVLAFFGIVMAIVQSIQAETEYFPGLRKPPATSHWNHATQSENAYLLARLTSIIEEQARRRFQQNQLQRQQSMRHLQLPWHSFPFVASAVPSQENVDPEFTFQFPGQPIGHSRDEGIPFAVNPGDPRYYDPAETKTISNQQQASNFEGDYVEMLGNRAAEYSAITNIDGAPSYKLKAPMEVRPKVSSAGGRDDINKLKEQLEKNGQERAIINNGQYMQRSDVIKKHLDLNTVDIYVVAVIAGVSATFSVGLIAIGIAWYTLHKKGLAAADVDYPAYGVTGPNKEISPSGDRRLAQSAQMYHYQHQKQQIIAMENRVSNEQRNGSLTDVESDEENEEGDYTVYECPGLAPTGEMEVKNPLFLDDPTPATPATNQQSDKSSQHHKYSTKTDTNAKK